MTTNYTYTITNSTSNTAPVAEGGTVTFTVTRSGSGSASDVYLSTYKGTADVNDYQSLYATTLSFAANETTKTVTLATYTDSAVEGTEYFYLELFKTYADAINYDWTSWSAAYVKDAVVSSNYSYTITSSANNLNAPATEGATVTFTIQRSGSGSASTVYLSTSDGTTDANDFQALSLSTLTFAANETTKTVTVKTHADNQTEYVELFWLDLYKSYADALNDDWASYGSAYIDDFGVGSAATGLSANKPAGVAQATSLGDVPGLGASATANLSQSFPGHSLKEFNNDYAFAALAANGSVMAWGQNANGGELGSASSALNGDIDVTHIYSNNAAFAALRADGSVVSWGNASAGGDSSAVAAALNGTLNVTQVFSTETAFAALREDGSVVTWGDLATGGDSSAVASKLNGDLDVSVVYSNMNAFAALRTDGSVVTWGFDLFGGNSSAVASQLSGTMDVTEVVATGSAFAAVRTDGSVVSWGSAGDGGNSSALASGLNGDVDVRAVCASSSAFAALRVDGSVLSWGDVNNGGDSSAVADQLNGSTDVSALASTQTAFAALRTDGSVVTWGNAEGGGNSSAVASALDGSTDVTRIYANGSAFAALRSDGSVVSWGYGAYGGDQSAVAGKLDGSVDVQGVVANDHAFAALRLDGSVVTWGSMLEGGDSTAVQSKLDGTVDVSQIYASSSAFAALRAYGTVVTWGNQDKGGDSSAVAANLTSIKNLTGDLLNAWAVEPNGTAPTVTAFSPVDEATDVAIASNIVVTFSEAIDRGTGNIVLKTAAGATVATYAAASSANLSIAGAVLTINPTTDLDFGTGYKVEFAAGSIKDLAGNSFAGSTSYNFTTAPAGNPRDNDFNAAQFASPSVVGAGVGDDTYLLSNTLLLPGKTVTLSDTVGNNSIQLAAGLAIASSKVMTNTLQLTLNTGAVVKVLGADKFTYEAGGNSTAGINQTDISYASFVQNTLGVTMPTGSAIAEGGALVIGGGAAAPVGAAQSVDDNFVIAQASSPSVLGSGAGNDTYLLSGPMLSADKTITLSDTVGANSIQLATGLSIKSCKVMTNTLQLTMDNNSVVKVLGADKFSYEAGGNSTAGINQTDLSYADFVAKILGLTMPTGSAIVSGGEVLIGGGGGAASTVLVVGSTAPVTATAQADNFSFNVAAAKATAADTQIAINGFAVAQDILTIDSVTALGAVKLSALDGVDGIAVQFDGIDAETLVNFGTDANGDVITLTLIGVTDPALVNISVV